jgi:hypothetical protein
MLRALLFCLLVLLTPVDDALARATPEPEDDATAAANNEFLADAVHESVVAQPPDLLEARLTAADRAPATCVLAHAAPASFRADPLYLFMSLQR